MPPWPLASLWPPQGSMALAAKKQLELDAPEYATAYPHLKPVFFWREREGRSHARRTRSPAGPGPIRPRHGQCQGVPGTGPDQAHIHANVHDQLP
eukprot:12927020-Prorocentrum_lima.AAC.1